MSVQHYAYGFCDLCNKELDTRKMKKSNDKGYRMYNFPTLSLYPSVLPSYFEKADFYQKTYYLCHDCAKKVAQLLYDTYGFYYESNHKIPQ